MGAFPFRGKGGMGVVFITINLIPFRLAFMVKLLVAGK